MPTVRGMIPMEGISQTKIVCGVSGRMCFLTIVSKNENGMRIMEVRPTFSVANCTSLALTCAPLSFLTSEHHMTDLATLRYLINYCVTIRCSSHLTNSVSVSVQGIRANKLFLKCFLALIICQITYFQCRRFSFPNNRSIGGRRIVNGSSLLERDRIPIVGSTLRRISTRHVQIRRYQLVGTSEPGRLPKQ